MAITPSPVVSILIPCYGRSNVLADTIRRLQKQQGIEFEIVVVDDHTPDDSVMLLSEQFPEIGFHRTSSNIGLIGARNFGARLCRSELIVNLDDDSYFIDPYGLYLAVETLSNSPKALIGAFNIKFKDRPLQWPAVGAPFLVPYYIGCGNIVRKACLDRIGPYVTEFIRQGEEQDRSMLVYDADGYVVGIPAVMVQHDVSSINRNPMRAQTYELANTLRREIMRCPAILLPLSVLRYLLLKGRWKNQIDRDLLSSLIEWESLYRTFYAKRKPMGLYKYIRWTIMRYRYGRLSFERYHASFSKQL